MDNTGCKFHFAVRGTEAHAAKYAELIGKLDEDNEIPVGYVYEDARHSNDATKIINARRQHKISFIFRAKPSTDGGVLITMTKDGRPIGVVILEEWSHGRDSNRSYEAYPGRGNHPTRTPQMSEEEYQQALTHWAIDGNVLNNSERLQAQARMILCDGGRQVIYWISTLVVAKDMRHRGYGSMLMEQAKEYADTHYNLDILLVAEEKQKTFYEKCGFQLRELGHLRTANGEPWQVRQFWRPKPAKPPGGLAAPSKATSSSKQRS